MTNRILSIFLGPLYVPKTKDQRRNERAYYREQRRKERELYPRGPLSTTQKLSRTGFALAFFIALLFALSVDGDGDNKAFAFIAAFWYAGWICQIPAGISAVLSALFSR